MKAHHLMLLGLAAFVALAIVMAATAEKPGATSPSVADSTVSDPKDYKQSEEDAYLASVPEEARLYVTALRSRCLGEGREYLTSAMYVAPPSMNDKLVQHSRTIIHLCEAREAHAYDGLGSVTVDESAEYPIAVAGP